MPAPTEEDLVGGDREPAADILSYGITSCMDAAVGQRGELREISAYHRAKREGRLPVQDLARAAWAILIAASFRNATRRV